MSPKKDNRARIHDLALALQLLVRRIRSAAPSESNALSWTQNAVLARLEKGGPATASELARAEGMKAQSMAVAIAPLEEMGLVERKPHPTDGRQVTVQLTARGAATRKQTVDAKEMWLVQAIEKLGREDREVLLQAEEVIKRLAEI